MEQRSLLEQARIFANEPIGQPRGNTEQLVDALADEIERLRFALIQMANAHSRDSGIAASTVLFHVTGLRWREVAKCQE